MDYERGSYEHQSEKRHDPRSGATPPRRARVVAGAALRRGECRWITAHTIESSDEPSRLPSSCAFERDTRGATMHSSLRGESALRLDRHARRPSCVFSAHPHLRSDEVAGRGSRLARRGRRGRARHPRIRARRRDTRSRRRGGLASCYWCHRRRLELRAGRGRRLGHGRRRLRRRRGRCRLLRCRGRRRCGSRRGDRGGRRRGCRGRVRSTPRREQGEWVDVGVLADPNTEMDVGDRVFRLAGRPWIRDRVSFGDDRAFPNVQRSEVGKRRLVPVARGDRHREAVRRNLTRERHLARRWRP
jgi:hypothetical protein